MSYQLRDAVQLCRQQCFDFSVALTVLSYCVHAVLCYTALLQVPFTSTEEFRSRLAAAGVPVTSLYLQNEDHFATVGQLMFEQGAQVPLQHYYYYCFRSNSELFASH
jgi:hypothetical protein